jgi:hypothetical protein
MTTWARSNRPIQIILLLESAKVGVEVSLKRSVQLPLATRNSDEEDQVLGILVHENLDG